MAVGYLVIVHIIKVGQNRVYTLYMTVYLVIFQPKKLHRMHRAPANPTCYITQPVDDDGVGIPIVARG